VEKDGVAAIPALYKSGSGELHVHGTAPSGARLGSPELGYSHDMTSFDRSFMQRIQPTTLHKAAGIVKRIEGAEKMNENF
jgi:hypothetical protein